MARGGKRVGAGRKQGSLTTRTRKVAEKAAATGQTPLEVMLENMRHFQKVALDAEYLQRQGFWFDIKILWLTFLKVVQRDGVSH